ncbi:MAG: glucosamine-6-phosphate deaminase [Verrucomicrobia bacterium]|nr:glucosamine-6-phosphate deaminase [Verrucomicrobiota bacterium]
MNISIHEKTDEANIAAADCLAAWLTLPTTRNVMVAGGNSPLEVYRLVAERKMKLSHLNIFLLDEYVGVPLAEPRNCANLLRRSVAEAWGIPASQFFTISSAATDALESVRQHEQRIKKLGGLDVIVLGLGQNGHLGFNEPGSTEDSTARLVHLDATSIAANCKWFGGDYAPSLGVTVGLKTILATRHILIMAYGANKVAAVKAMIEEPRSAQCPASFLQNHLDVRVLLDRAAAARLSGKS